MIEDVKTQANEELESMGVDIIKRDRQYNAVIKAVALPIVILASLGVGIKDVATSFGSIFKNKDKEKLNQFKRNLQIAFKSYIELEIKTAETTLRTKYERSERCRAISLYQKEIKDLTHEQYQK